MPKFAANLSLMFTEHDFLDRFDAAAAAGFSAVEFLFPYDHPAATIAERLRRNDLTQALFNLPPGDWSAGERGLAALPDRFEEFKTGLDRALAPILRIAFDGDLFLVGGAVRDELLGRQGSDDFDLVTRQSAPELAVFLFEQKISSIYPVVFERFGQMKAIADEILPKLEKAAAHTPEATKLMEAGVASKL